MVITTLKDNLLIGNVSHPLGSSVEVDEQRARLLIYRGVATPAIEVDFPPIEAEVETAALAMPSEIASLPRPRSRRGAVTQV